MSFFEMLLYVGHPLFVPKAVKALKNKMAAVAAAAAAAAAEIEVEQAQASIELSRHWMPCGEDCGLKCPCMLLVDWDRYYDE